MSSPLFPPVPRPTDSGGATAVVLPCVLSELDAEAVAREAITGRKLAPADVADARVAPPRLLAVPFWRIEVSADGFHLGLSGGSIAVGGAKLPIPTGGSRHERAAVVVCARTAFPYEARLPALLQRVVGEPPLDIPVQDLVGLPAPTSAPAYPDAETVDADLSRADAERAALKLLVRSVAPQNALYAKAEPEVLATTFALYPVYWSSYVYEGEAKRHAGERFFVAVSGRNGKVVAAHHPSGLRAAAARFRRLLGG